METINGEWYLKGCAWNDPGRLKTVQDAAARIREMGFVPLFSNELPGFSIEEQTAAERWWSGDELTDPWSWRQLLAGEPDILYGKFFGRRAGFIARDWFPVFANSRRDGYDFDTLCDEGIAPYREQKLMTPFLTDGMPNATALFSCDLKAQAGFGKGGEKNFEGVLTDLQMKTYLIIGDFRQKLNKRGLPYGWHIARIQTPEAKLGYDFIAEGYNEPPEASLQRIIGHLQAQFPNADLQQIQKALGIRKK